MDEESWSGVHRFKVLNRLCLRIFLVTRTDRTLVNHALQESNQEETKVLDQWENNVYHGGLRDE